MTKENKYNLKIEDMAKAGLHFGHKKESVNPNMEPYLYGLRNSVFLIDLEKTKEKLEEALDFVDKLVSEGKQLMVVGTQIAAKELVKEFGEECNIPYVSERWIGGTFTNFKVIRKRIEHFVELKEKKEAGVFEDYTKKEKSDIESELKGFERRFGGIKDLKKLPDGILLLSMKKNFIATKEAREQGVTVIGVCDADYDPTEADYPIPANDNSVDSVKYILDKFKNVILEAQKKAPKVTIKNKKK
jgi:small subunit ribosomal protein S2